MEKDIIYSDEYIEIAQRTDGFYIESFRNGMSVDQFNKLIGLHSSIKIISFIAIKNALLFAPRSPVKFGEAKERITVDISSDELKAYVTLCVSESEFVGDRLNQLIKEIILKLNEKGIVFGIRNDVFLNNLCNNRQILIAEGVLPENGKDSQLRMYELKDPKPEAKEDGNVDHYELNLINRVDEGDWLGERIDPTNGVEGKSVKGKVIVQLPGKKYPLLYDKRSVKEVSENGITTLYALNSGAVHFDGDRVSVSNHLEIDSNVDFKTGNIDFEGYLTVKGSVEDNFSISSTKDIEILGDYGVGSVREIFSRDGSIYIKGGIVGKNKSVVKSKKDIYTKFISDATIICEGSVHIGFYCINSHITAREVIIDSPKGQIIGGNIQAEVKVVASIIGSASEKRTYINIKGFERDLVKERLERLITKVEKVKNELTRVKQEVAIYSNTNELSREQLSLYEDIKEKYFEIRNDLKALENERKIFVSCLRAHGEGEVVILKKAYAGTFIEIKKEVKDITQTVLGTCFYIQDGEIKEIT